MNERAEREERDDDEVPRGRAPAGESRTSPKRRLGKKGKKRRIPRGAGARSRKRTSTASRGTRRGHAPEPPPILPQPSLDSLDDEPVESPDERPEQEPPPPTASTPEDRPPGGDADDLFEYFF